MNKERVSYLCNLYLDNKAGTAELLELESVLKNPALEDEVKDVFFKAYDAKMLEQYPGMSRTKSEQVFQLITDDINTVKVGTRKGYSIWSRIAAAAAIVLIIGAALFYWNDFLITKKQSLAGTAHIKPGSNKATLTLANGKKILLSEALNGELLNADGISITKTADGSIVYDISGAPSGKNNLNTLSTANGQSFQLRLPDGSLVWLNAASSLTYTATLNEKGIRRVKLNGEAYFEVAKDKMHPFVVETGRQEVEVLGTHFNIKSYADEGDIKTTLLEGSVRIVTGKQSRILRPGQQANLTNELVITEANAEEVLAWKQGYFVFDDERLESVMNKIARWYDVKVIYRDNSIKNELFAAVTTRFGDFSVLLKMLEMTGGVKFDIDGRTVIVDRKK